MEALIYAFVSVIAVSLVSLVGVVLLIRDDFIRKAVMYMVSFAAGTLLGDAFIHLLPEIVEEIGFTSAVSLSALAGIIVFFMIEKIIRWRHCHEPPDRRHPHPFSYMIVIGDGIHNFIDGMIIAGAYIVSIPLGIVTTIAVVMHEIPQEIGDFSSLIYGGFTKKRAILFNFLSALTAVLGTAAVFALSFSVQGIQVFMVPFAAGGFIYIAAADLIPEIHKNEDARKSFFQLVFFLLGLLVMWGLLFLE